MPPTKTKDDTILIDKFFAFPIRHKQPLHLETVITFKMADKSFLFFF